MIKKSVLFVTGSRADYGKLKPLIRELEKDTAFEASVFVCGMHMSSSFGETYKDILKDNFKNVYFSKIFQTSEDICINLSKTIDEMTQYVKNKNFDIIIVHGDRVEALAGAIVGVLHNIIVAHIEGGEVSGSVDEFMRHAITKLSHAHFVCTNDAKKRVEQLGEEKNRIFLIGSPDIDVMLSKNLPDIKEVKEKFKIDFDNYGILLYHPVVTEIEKTQKNIKEVVDAVIESGYNYIVIYPNNDPGYQEIIAEYTRFNNNRRIKIYPSIEFESFLTLLKNAEFIIGNSSAGIRESGVYSVPAIDIGKRQNDRYDVEVVENVQHVDDNKSNIINAIDEISSYRKRNLAYGTGNSAKKFCTFLKSCRFSNIKIQKEFIDYIEN